MMPDDPGHRIRLDVRLQDTAGGETIAEESVSGDESRCPAAWRVGADDSFPRRTGWAGA